MPDGYRGEGRLDTIGKGRGLGGGDLHSGSENGLPNSLNTQYL